MSSVILQTPDLRKRMPHSFVFCTLCFWRLVGFCVAMETVSINEGDSVTLHSNVTEIQNDDLIMWTFGDQKIAEINAAAGIFKTHDPDGRFRDRLKLDHQTGSLTITDTRNTDSGLYLITISGTIVKEYRYNVTVYGITPRGSPVWISTATAGSLFIVAVLGIFCICKRLRKTAQEVQTHKEEVIYAEPTHHKQNSHKRRFKEKDEVVYAAVTKSG